MRRAPLWLVAVMVKSLFPRGPLEAAYSPLSLDPRGRVYARNAGDFFVVGR